MQKRYCSCGQVVWVEYTPSSHRDIDWRAVFRPAGDANAAVVLRCPSCERRLDVDRLR